MTNAVSIAQIGSNNTTFRNRIINGAMVIDQRNAGASVTATADIYCVDRWAVGYGTTVNAFTAQQSTTVPSGFKNSLLITAGTGASAGAGGYAYLRHMIEGLNVYDLGWGTASASTITISFWVRSSLTGTFGFVLRNSAADRAYGATFTISSANTFEYKTVTIPGDTSGTWLTTNGIGIGLFFDLGAGTNTAVSSGSWQTFSNALGVSGVTKLTATTGATFYITGVQLEAGSTASPFEYRSYTTELQLAQRYFQKIDKDYMPYNVPLFNGGSNTIWAFTFPVIMRAGPTLTYSGNTTINYFNSAGGAQQNTNLTAISGGYNSTLGGARIYHTLLGQAGLTGWIEIAGGTGSFAFSSEL